MPWMRRQHHADDRSGRGSPVIIDGSGLGRIIWRRLTEWEDGSDLERILSTHLNSRAMKHGVVHRALALALTLALALALALALDWHTRHTHRPYILDGWT